jgi:F-type H+-transporting ATPase subunit c
MLAVLGVFFGMLAFSWMAFAQPAEGEGEAAAAEGGISAPEAERGKFVALAIGLGLGLAAAGGALGQGRATSAAVEGLARNPGSYDKVFLPFILGMVLIESLVIYSLVISLILLGSLGG